MEEKDKGDNCIKYLVLSAGALAVPEMLDAVFFTLDSQQKKSLRITGWCIAGVSLGLAVADTYFRHRDTPKPDITQGKSRQAIVSYPTMSKDKD